MKNNPLVGESIISAVLIGLLIMCWNPSGKVWMPTMAMSMVLLGLIVAFMVFAAFVWRERARDEREEQHRLLSGRVGFLSGALVLLLGIVSQMYMKGGHPDPWLVVALATMVIAKLGARVYSEYRK